MSKLIVFTRTKSPSNNGYLDPVFVLNEVGEQLGIFNGRSGPNPKHPKTGKPWDTCYGYTAIGLYDGVWGIDARGKYCIILNEGKELPACVPNSNNQNRCVVKGVEVHCGWADDDPATPQDESWSGSAGCLTIKKAQWETFCKLFVAGEKVKVEIRGLS
jgi:hypothetical protein